MMIIVMSHLEKMDFRLSIDINSCGYDFEKQLGVKLYVSAWVGAPLCWWLLMLLVKPQQLNPSI